jgi:hypothetical protein
MTWLTRSTNRFKFFIQFFIFQCQWSVNPWILYSEACAITSNRLVSSVRQGTFLLAGWCTKMAAGQGRASMASFSSPYLVMKTKFFDVHSYV